MTYQEVLLDHQRLPAQSSVWSDPPLPTDLTPQGQSDDPAQKHTKLQWARDAVRASEGRQMQECQHTSPRIATE